MSSQTSTLSKTPGALVSPPTTAQQLYLFPNGHIIFSDDTVFETQHLKDVPVQTVFPVIESCFLLFFQPDNVAFTEFMLPGVNLTFNQQVAYFDFYFIKIFFDSQEAIFWWMEDRTPFYLQKQQAQQLLYQKIVLG